MSRILSLGLAALVIPAVCAAAESTSVPAGVQQAFGNTIVSTYPDGRQAELWLEPSGAYTAMGRRHDPSSGHWHVKGDKLCLRQSHPSAVPFTYCTPIPSGDSWSAKSVFGDPIQVKLVKGHSEPGSAS